MAPWPPLAAVFSSDLARAVETVAIAFAGTEVPVRADPRLRDCDYGRLNGAAVAQLSPRSRFIATPFPGGESYRDVAERVRHFIGDLAPYDGRRVLVVGHSTTRWALEHLLAGRELEELLDAPLDWQTGWLYRTNATP